jgi:hypothetical protein
MLQLLQRGIEALRQPDRNPRCYEMTEQDRSDCIREWNNRNVWNTPARRIDTRQCLAQLGRAIMKDIK